MKKGKILLLKNKLKNKYHVSRISIGFSSSLFIEIESKIDISYISILYSDWFLYKMNNIILSADDPYSGIDGEINESNKIQFEINMRSTNAKIAQILIDNFFEELEVDFDSNSIIISFIGEYFLLIKPNMNFFKREMMTIRCKETFIRCLIDEPVSIVET